MHLELLFDVAVSPNLAAGNWHSTCALCDARFDLFPDGRIIALL